MSPHRRHTLLAGWLLDGGAGAGAGLSSTPKALWLSSVIFLSTSYLSFRDMPYFPTQATHSAGCWMLVQVCPLHEGPLDE